MVVAACLELLPTDQTKLSFFLEENSNGKFAVLGSARTAFIPGSPGSKAQPLRLQLLQAGSVKISARVTATEKLKWISELQQIKEEDHLLFEILSGGEKDRMRISPITLSLVKTQKLHGYLKRLFQESCHLFSQES